ncbi:STAS domain-containing protein [Actinomycetospora lemnae]|uniref:STAS domain-containing protein n=1 Tax=Actinomycetospora lemnae TaxID=3019891 RepID=A0ABT5T0Q8_9PSEU|nr:STAS domain-containing protein [Actinomycetospora sp. DW7H6]MDD7968692.1 STAS domain-containing protein [Actinomycetospora sp. DW7H6]
MMAPRERAGRPSLVEDVGHDVDTDHGGLTVAPTQPRPGLVLLRVIGEVDMLTARHLADVLHGSVTTVADDRDVAGRANEPPAVVADLEGVTFLGASGLDVLADVNVAATARDVRLVLVATHRTVLHPIRLTALDRCLDLADTDPALGRGASPDWSDR